VNGEARAPLLSGSAREAIGRASHAAAGVHQPPNQRAATNTPFWHMRSAWKWASLKVDEVTGIKVR